MKRKAVHPGLAVFVFGLCSLNSAQAQTPQFLEAPVVGPQMRVRWNTATKTMEWAPGHTDDYSDIGVDALFLAKGPVAILYQELNPLKLQAVASTTAAEDPAHATLAKLIESFTSLVGIIQPAVASPATAASNARVASTSGKVKPAACTDTNSADTNGQLLATLLYGSGSSSETVGSKVKNWIKIIDDGLAGGPNSVSNGATAVQQAVDAIQQDAKDLGDTITAAQGVSDRIDECSTAPTLSTLSTSLQSDYTHLSLTKGSTDARLDQLTALKGVYTQLATSLASDYAVPVKWIGRDFQISTKPVLATSQNMQKITVTVSSLSLKVDDRSGTLSTPKQDAGSATFTIRRYSLFTTEVGVGAVFAKIKPPKYGTAINAAGQTVVAPASGTSVSVNPSILVNFVCRCWSGPFVPMLQVGSAVSKDTPAFLLGAGIRLFAIGKGDLAIGGGAMFAWVKDLQNLKVGSVVSGTSAIDADLGFSSTPRIRGYLVLQFKF